MNTPDDWSTLEKVLGAAGTVLAVLVYPVIKMRNWIDQRFEEKVDKEAFEAHVKKNDKDRDERRETEIKLFDKLDQLKDLIIGLRK